MTDPTPAEALKACPFCGGAAIIWGTSSTSIQCTNDQCIIGESAPFNDFSHRADAIAAWNKRPDAGGVRTYRDGVAKEGWLLMPAEPTPEMIAAAWDVVTEAKNARQIH